MLKNVNSLLFCGVFVVATASTTLLANDYRDWTENDFLATWGTMPIENTSTMTLIEHNGFNFLWVGARFDLDDGGTGQPIEWDVFGMLTNWEVYPLPDHLSQTSFDLADLGDDEGTVRWVEFWIAGTLVGANSHALHVTALANAIAIYDEFGNTTYSNVFFQPDRVWNDLASAHAAMAEMQSIFQSSFGTMRSEENEPGPGPEPINKCIRDFWDDYADCADKLAERLQDCLDDADDKRAEAEARLNHCLDGVGIWDRIKTACLLGGGGAILGGGVGSIVPILGTSAGGLAVGCGGLIGGFAGGAAKARGDCYNTFAEDLAAAIAVLELCAARAQERFDDCVDDATDKFLDCLAGVH